MAMRVYVDGQEGTTGLQIHQRLGGRQDIELLLIDPGRRKDIGERKALLNAADIAFLCLPDDAARQAVQLVENPNTRILDASTAHRVHPDWVYGLPELSKAQRGRIEGASRLSVPGCHATGFILGVAPLIASGILPEDSPVSCHSITGYSGGGRGMIAEYENPDRDTACSGTRPYALSLTHKHLPEMRAHAGLVHAPLFDPILGDYAQGMLVCIPIHTACLKGGADARRVHEVLLEWYEGQSFVRVAPFEGAAQTDGGRLNPMARNGTNMLDLFVFSGEGQALIVARFDNLGKGASGAAVQCMNLMLGMPEHTSLL